MGSLRIEPIAVHTDERGSLHKVHPDTVEGEVYLVRARPGVSRGHHLHTSMGEWFTAISGEGMVVVEDPDTGEKEEASLNDQRVYVPAGLAHALFNTGESELVVLACAEAYHDPTDVHPHPVSRA